MNSKWLTLVCTAVVTLGLSSQQVFAREGMEGASGRHFHHKMRGERRHRHKARPVSVDVLTPERGHRVGIDGKGWFVDLEIEFDTTLADTGFTANADGSPDFQLTGPGPHNDVPPMPGTFSPGPDDRLPGLIVLLTTTTVGAGPCMNLANLFNLTGVTDLQEDKTEIWATWIIGASNFGVATPSRLFVAIADDLNGDGIYNDAPFSVPDVNGDGICTARDLRAFGVASNIERVRFYINGAVDLSGLPMSL